MAKGNTRQPAEGIIATAADLVSISGVGALSARAVAQQAGLSPSAVNYHLGGREGLIRALRLRTRDEFQKWTETRFEALNGLPSDLLSPPSLIAGFIGDLAMQPWAVAMIEFRELHGREPELGDAAEVKWLSMEALWDRLLERFHVDDNVEECWRILALGAFSLALVDTDALVRSVWLSQVVHRTAERLAGRRRFDRVEPQEVQFPAVAPSEQPEGRRRIIETSIRMIGEQGVADLTHRRVAAAAGLSLAATTYFFKTKNEMIFEAFRELHRRAFARLASSNPRAANSLSNLLLNKNGDPHWEVGAMTALYTAAARDPALRPFATDLRRARGIGSLRWLAGQGVTGLDRTDGLIWSLIVGGLFQAALLVPKRQRRTFVDRTSKRLLQTLFLGPDDAD
ncbi:MAG TPA: TetR family transcriptional regulator [Alphaproteobacteria bacterium]|nr:TetR family transcriptional regulator [Alphaproteobacteria bacterium]